MNQLTKKKKEDTGKSEKSEKREKERKKEKKKEKINKDSSKPTRTITRCRFVHDYIRLDRIDEGSYGVVYRAKDKETGEIFALKKLKYEKEKNGFSMSSLREVKVLMNFKHPHIVNVKEIVVGSHLNAVYIVMECVDNSLRSLLKKHKTVFSTEVVKRLLIQLLSAVSHLHDNWVFHRDLKTSNLLYDNKGALKICDFGMAREYSSPVEEYTHHVMTAWYRAPEILLGEKIYTKAVDMWSVGCIFGELFTCKPLFAASTCSDIEQIDLIYKLLGCANEEIWPGYNSLPNVQNITFNHSPDSSLREKFPNLSDNGFDLLNKMLTYDPKKRITANEALKHPYFEEEPLPQPLDSMPTFPSSNKDERDSS